jgi:iron complex outermembrane receptor protein
MRQDRRSHIRNVLYAGVAFAALSATSAMAQAASPEAASSAGGDKRLALAQNDQVPESKASPEQATSVAAVEVTGFRRSQATALKLTQKADDFVEAVTVEDIGKLPDESIADSLARLPGLASQRNNNGRWQDISVDGLPPAMSTTLFNGFMQATTDNNRVTQFDQYPAEILNSVVVYKSGDAALIGGSIATVDMRTIRPLEYGKTTLAIGAQGEYDTRGKLQPGADALGYRVNATFITNWNDKIGVMVGYTRMVAPNQIFAQHPYGFNQPDYVVTGLQDQVRSDTLTRDGFVSTVQWRPNDQLEFTLDGFTSSYDDNALIRGVEIQTACCGNATMVGTPSPGVSSWIVAPQLQNYDYEDKARLRSIDLTAKYEIAPGWRVEADYGYSDATRYDSRIELYSGFGINGHQNHSTVTLTSGTGAGGMIGASNWSESLTDLTKIALGENLPWQQGWWPSSWPGGNINGMNIGSMFGSAYYQKIDSYDAIQQAHGAINHDLSGFFLSNIEVGLAYSTRRKNYIDHEGIGALTSGNESQPIPGDWVLQPTSMAAFGLPNLFSIDPVKAWASGAYAYLERPDELAHDWWVSEHVLTPYIETKVNTEIGGRPLTGNAGVQFVHTSQMVTTFAQTGGWPNFIFFPVPVTTKYWDILPSLNLTWHFTDNQDFRLGVDRSLARPRFDQMGGNSSVNYDPTKANCQSVAAGCSPWGGSVANPKLKPWLSDDVNLAWEYFFAPGEGVSVEGFYKNLETFIYDKTTIGDFTAFFNAGHFSPAPVIFQGPVSEFVNANGGHVLGVTLSANVSLKHLWSGLDGFGVAATGTYIDSNVHIPDPGTSPTGRIPELSKYVANLTLYYEKGGFSIRFNDRFRSTYVQEVPNFDGSLQAIEGAKENTIDVQAGYTFREGRFKGLSVTFAAENVTDTPMNSFLKGDPRQPEYYKLFGTNLLFGVSYRY